MVITFVEISISSQQSRSLPQRLHHRGKAAHHQPHRLQYNACRSMQSIYALQV